MPDIKHVLRVDNRLDYYERHLSIVNAILPKRMTPSEIRVLAAFMSLEGVGNFRFSSIAKRMVMELLDISSSGLSNHMKGLRDKGFIRDIEDNTLILPFLMPSYPEQAYIFKVINIVDSHPVNTNLNGQSRKDTVTASPA